MREEIRAAPHKPADQPSAFLKRPLTFCNPPHPGFGHLIFSSVGFRQALLSRTSTVQVAGVKPWEVFSSSAKVLCGERLHQAFRCRDSEKPKPS